MQLITYGSKYCQFLKFRCCISVTKTTSLAWTGDFIENQPDENTPPTELTKFKIVYDKKFLYFAFKYYDKNPKGIVKIFSRRDGFEGDWVEINIDSYHDKRTGFSFTASVSGV